MNRKALLRGATILGAGGGGSVDMAKKIMSNEFKLISFSDLKDNHKIATVFFYGSMKDCSGITMPLNAFNLLFKRFKVKAIIPIEIGPLALAVASEVANCFGLPVIDSDVVGGRSSPSIRQELYSIKKIKRTPLVVVSKVKSRIVRRGNLDKILSKICKREGLLAIAGYVTNVKDIKDILQERTISKTECIGKMEIEDIIQFMDGKPICRGKINYVKIKKDKRFLLGSFLVDKTRVFFKNEYALVIDGGKPIAKAPDYICVFDRKLNRGLLTSEIQVGRDVMVFSAPAIKIWQNKDYLKLWDSAIPKIILKGMT